MSLQAEYKRPFKPRFGTPLERFERLVEKTDSCWIWKGTRHRNGYGWFWMKRGRQIKSHRAAWELFRGPIPDGLHVCHKCDNPPCVNPDHFFVGTHQDNNRDKMLKGRHRSGRSGGNPKGNPKKKEFCKRGHAYAGENIMKNGVGRTCKACYSMRATKRRSADRSGS